MKCLQQLPRFVNDVYEPCDFAVLNIEGSN